MLSWIISRRICVIRHLPKRTVRRDGVTVQFVVDEDGSIKDSKVLRSVWDKDMDAEALRLINTMPKWKPGRQKGQPVAVKFTVPVMFRLDDDKLEKNFFCQWYYS